MAEKRIYLVNDKEKKDSVYLVRAQTPARAERFVTNKHFVAKVASQDDCIAAAAKGIKVEEAGE